MLLKVDIEKVRIKRVASKSIWIIEYQEKIYGDEKFRSNLWSFWKFDSAYSDFSMAEARLKQISTQKFTKITVDDYVLQIDQ